MDIDLVTPPAAAVEFRRHQCGHRVVMPFRAFLDIFGPAPPSESLWWFLRNLFDATMHEHTATVVVPERLRPELPLWFGCWTTNWGHFGEEAPALEPFVRVEVSRAMDRWFVAFALEWKAPTSWRQRPSLLNA